MEVMTNTLGKALIAFLDGCRLDEVRLHWKRAGLSWKFTGGKTLIESGPLTSRMYVAGECAMELAGLGPMNRTTWNAGDDERAHECTKLGLLADRNSARSLLTRHWSVVKALTVRLMEVQRIGGPEAEAIIMEHLDITTRARLRSAA